MDLNKLQNSFFKRSLKLIAKYRHSTINHANIQGTQFYKTHAIYYYINAIINLYNIYYYFQYFAELQNTEHMGYLPYTHPHP